MSTGDVLARYTVRRDEFAASAALAAYLIESHTGPTEYAATTPTTMAQRAAVSASSKAGAAPSCTASKSTRDARITRAQDRRPVLVQLARAARRDGRHDRPRLPADQQELQPVLRRQRPVMIASVPPTRETNTLCRCCPTVLRVPRRTRGQICCWEYSQVPLNVRLGRLGPAFRRQRGAGDAGRPGQGHMDDPSVLSAQISRWPRASPRAGLRGAQPDPRRPR